MLIADIKGKLTLKEWTSEDFLTSSVFSTFKYIDKKWFHDFIKQAKNINNKNLSIDLDNIDFEFWPSVYLDHKNYTGYIEPDLVIYSNMTALILEAKLFSGKSGSGLLLDEEDTILNKQPKFTVADQLAKEYFIGTNKSLNRKFDDFYLIFITKHTTIPRQEIEETLSTIEKTEPFEKGRAINKIFWINWQKAYLTFENITKIEPLNSSEHKLSTDIIQFLDRRNLGTFSGFKFTESFLKTDFLEFSGKLTKQKNIFFHQKKENYWTFLKNIKKQDITLERMFYRKSNNYYWNFSKIRNTPFIYNTNTIFYA